MSENLKHVWGSSSAYISVEHNVEGDPHCVWCVQDRVAGREIGGSRLIEYIADGLAYLVGAVEDDWVTPNNKVSCSPYPTIIAPARKYGYEGCPVEWTGYYSPGM